MPIFAIFHSFADIKGPINGLWVFLSLKTTLNPLPNDLRKSKSQKTAKVGNSSNPPYLPTVYVQRLNIKTIREYVVNPQSLSVTRIYTFQGCV